MAEDATMESGLVAKEEAAHPYLSAGKAFLENINPVRGAGHVIDSFTHASSMPWDNPINQLATNLYNAHKDTFNKGEEAMGESMDATDLKGKLGGLAKSAGYSLATMVPGIGPAAAHAAETMGGDPNALSHPKPPNVLKGAAEGGGLIAATLLGGLKSRAAGKVLKALTPAEEAEEMMKLPQEHPGAGAAAVAATAHGVHPSNVLQMPSDPAIAELAEREGEPWSDRLPASEASPIQPPGTAAPAIEDPHPVSIDYDEDGNITGGDGRHRVIQAMQEGDKPMPVRIKMRDGNYATVQMAPSKIAEKMGVTPQSILETDAQQTMTRAGGGKPRLSIVKKDQ